MTASWTGETLRHAGRLVTAIAIALWLAAAAPAQPARVSGVEAVGFTVSDIDRSVAFFSEVLSFEPLDAVEIDGPPYEEMLGVPGLRARVVRLRLGDESIELSEYRTPRGRPLPPDSHSNDLWFQHLAIIVSDMDRAYAHLQRHRVEHVSPEPQVLPAWNQNAGGIRAFYFKDPDGHVLEILQFPRGKGAEKWHRRSDRLFLGIDHTAIAIDDTNTSLAFYRDGLGMQVAGTSENHGCEQERLSNVHGARLRITTLRAGSGPGIELLEYLAPPGGRAAPVDLRANDLAHWQTRLAVAAAGLAEEQLAATRRLSAGFVEIPAGELGFRRGLIVRDPDGHALQLVVP